MNRRLACRSRPLAWALTALLAGCHSPDAMAPVALPARPLQDITVPTHHRNWQPDQAVLPHAELGERYVSVHNIRDFRWQNAEDYVVKYQNKTFDLDQLETVEFIVVPFKDTPSLAHTMLSFGFQDGEYLGVSVEARLEVGETYSPLLGGLRQYELIYVLADEKDLIARRAHRNDDVYLYPTVASQAQARELFVDVMQRVNQLAAEPEFYDTLTNNCTTNLVRHINRLRPGRVPYDLRVLLPGFSDQLAYELGLLKTSLPFTVAREQSRVSALALRHLDQTDFSKKIRRR